MTDWQILGLEPVNDKRAIKRAYAKKIKTIDPAVTPELFQQVRESYEYLINHGRLYIEPEDEQIVNDSEDQIADELGVEGFDSKGIKSVSDGNAATENTSEQTSEQARLLPIDNSSEKELVSDAVSSDLEAETDSESGADSESESETENETDTDTKSETRLDASNEQTYEILPPLGESELASLIEETPRNDSASNGPSHQPPTATDLVMADVIYPEQAAIEFINELEKNYNEEKLEFEQWKEFLHGESLQYIEVTNLLRFKCFAFFVEKVQQKASINEPINVTLRALPKEIKNVISYYAHYFDWQNSEFLLAEYFSHEEMKLLSDFYRPGQANKTPQTTEKSSGWSGTSFFFWIVFFIFLTKAFSGLNKRGIGLGSNESNPISSQEMLEKLTPKSCRLYSNIKDDDMAEYCLNNLSADANSERFNLAFYWLMRFQDIKNERLDKVSDILAGDGNDRTGLEEEIDIQRPLDLSIQLLEEGTVLGHLPSIKLLAAINLSPYYGMQDKATGVDLLQQAVAKEDIKSSMILGINYYLGIWQEKDSERARSYFQMIPDDETELDFNQKYVLATLYWLGLKIFNDNRSKHTNKSKAKSIFDEASKQVDFEYLNTVAWYFATTSSVESDPKLAKLLANEMGPMRRATQDWRYLDTIAACYAANGEFLEAIETLSAAKQQFENSSDDYSQQQQSSNLDWFEKTRQLYLAKKKIEVNSGPDELEQVLRSYMKELMKVDV